MQLKRQHFIAIGPMAAILFYYLLTANDLAHMPATAAAITLLTVIWWVSEALPIPATSLVPLCFTADVWGGGS